MAYIKVGSTFTPFTYEEKIRPFLDYAEAYENIYKNIEQLEEEDDWIEYIKNDPQYSTLYSQYLNNLESLSSDLNTSGLNSEIYNKLRNLKSSYKKNFVPIKTRVDRKKMLAEEQRKLKMTNPHIHFDTDYSNIDVSNPLLDNPEASYNTLDGNIIENSTIKLGSSLAKQLRNPNAPLTPSADNKFLLGNQRYGYSREEMSKAIEGDPNAPVELLEVVQSIKDSYNYDEQSEEFKSVIDNYIYRGLQASASEVINPIRLNNPSYMTRAQAENARLTTEINKRKLAEGDIYIDRLGNMYKWDPTTEKYVLSEETEEEITRSQKNLNGTPYASVMAYVDGEWHFTDNIATKEDKGEKNVGGLFSGRTWSSRSQVVSGGDISLKQANEAEDINVVSDMKDLLRYFSNTKSLEEIQKDLQDNQIELPLDVIEYIQTAYGQKNNYLIGPFEGRSANTLYLVKVAADKRRGKEGGSGDYIIINEASAKDYPAISTQINTYNTIKPTSSQPVTDTYPQDDDITKAAKDFAAAGSR